MLSSLCHSFPLTSNTDAVFVSVIPVSTCIFSDLPVLLDQGLVLQKSNDFKTRVEDKRGEFNFDSVNVTALLH